MTKVEQNLEKWNVFSPHKLCIGLASYGYKYTNLQLGNVSNQFLRFANIVHISLILLLLIL